MVRADELASPRLSTWLRVEVVRDGAAFAALRPEWSALHARSRAGVFTTWEWLYPWYRRIGSDRALHLLTARDERGELVGLMPLCVERRRAAGRQLRRLAWLGESHVGSDYLDVISLPGEEEPVARAFARTLQETQGTAWDVLDLLDLEAGSDTLSRLEGVAGAHRVTERYVCPYQRFTPGEGFDAFLRRTGRRDNFLRRKKWWEKQPGFRLERHTQPGELARPMADFFRLHAMRWQEDGGSQGIKGPGVEAFHRDATQLLAERGWLRLYTLRLEGRALAAVYGIVHKGTFHYFQSGYDPAWRNKSVGLVLVGETFREAIGEGLQAYDFLRGTESYKSDWTTDARRTVAFRAWEPGSRGAWLGRQEEATRLGSQLLQRVLPGPWVEGIRRARRRLAAI